MSTTIAYRHTARHPAGYLVIKDPTIDVTVTSDLPERIDHLKEKISFLKKHDPSMKFSHTAAPHVGEFSLQPSISSSEGEKWAKELCQSVCHLLYAQANFEFKRPSYSLFSATYQGWAEESFSSLILDFSNSFKEELKKAPEDASLEDLVELATTKAKELNFDPCVHHRVLSSYAVYLSSRFEGTSALRAEVMLYDKLEIVPFMKLEDPLYAEWASSHLTDTEIATYQKLLQQNIKRLADLPPNTHWKNGEIHSSTITALAQTISSNGSQKNGAEIEVDLYKKAEMSLDSRLYKDWANLHKIGEAIYGEYGKRNLSEEQKKTSDALLACLNGLILPDFENYSEVAKSDAVKAFVSSISEVLEQAKDTMDPRSREAFFLSLNTKFKLPNNTDILDLLLKAKVSVDSKLYALALSHCDKVAKLTC